MLNIVKFISVTVFIKIEMFSNSKSIFLSAVLYSKTPLFRTLKGTTSRLTHLEKFSLNFTSSSFVIRVNL